MREAKKTLKGIFYFYIRIFLW